MANTVVETQFKSEAIQWTYRVIFLFFLSSLETRKLRKNIKTILLYKGTYGEKSKNLF